MIKVIDDYLEDILQKCNHLLKRSANLTYEEFIENENLKRAFVRSLEIIGEAAKKDPTRDKRQISRYSLERDCWHER